MGVWYADSKAGADSGAQDDKLVVRDGEMGDSCSRYVTRHIV